MLDEQMKEETRAIQQGAPVDSHVEEFRLLEEVDTGDPDPDESEGEEGAAGAGPEEGSTGA